MAPRREISESGIVASAVGVLYPFIIAFSIYLIVTGHKNPGGGFQGGAMFAALFIIRVLGLSVGDVNIKLLYALKKLLVFFIALIPIVAIFFNLLPREHAWMAWYLVSIQALIGVNVGISFTILVFCFVFYTQES